MCDASCYTTPTPTPTPTCAYSSCQYSNSVLPCKCGTSNTATASSPYCCSSAWNGFVTNSKATCDANCGTATPTPTTSCYDSDGHNFNTSGYCTDSTGYTFNDKCSGSTVVDYYCNNNLCQYDSKFCSTGCSGGKCNAGSSFETQKRESQLASVVKMITDLITDLIAKIKGLFK